MTRRDYVLIMEVFRVELNRANLSLASERKGTPNYDHVSGSIVGILHAAHSMADSLAHASRAFNSEHFMAVIRGEKPLDSRPSDPVSGSRRT